MTNRFHARARACPPPIPNGDGRTGHHQYSITDPSVCYISHYLSSFHLGFYLFFSCILTAGGDCLKNKIRYHRPSCAGPGFFLYRQNSFRYFSFSFLFARLSSQVKWKFSVNYWTGERRKRKIKNGHTERSCPFRKI